MIQVINRGLDILEFIAREPEKAKSLGEISQHLGLHAATCANILKTLINRNYVEQVAPKKGYILGPMAYFLSRNGPYRKDIVKIAEPLMAKLAKDVQETVLIVTLSQGRRSILCQIDGNQTLQIKTEFLFREDVYICATGRLLLACLAPNELEAFIIKNGLPGKAWPDASTSEKLKAALEKIRREGTVIFSRQPEVVGIAFSIKEGARIVAALGLFLPTIRFEGSHKSKILDGMKKTAEEISSRLTAMK